MGIAAYTMAGAIVGALVAQVFVAGSESQWMLTAVAAGLSAMPGYLLGVARTPDDRRADDA